MKKIVFLVLLICLLFTGFISYRQVLAVKAEREAAASSDEAEIIPVEVALVDREALLASHAPDEVVATVDGKEIRWDEYYYFYSSFIEEVEHIFTYFGAYGYSLTWEDEYEEGMLFSEVPPVNAEGSICQYTAIEALAQEKGITLSEETEEELRAQTAADAERYCGEGATEEQLEAYLAEIYLPLSVYRQMLRTNALYRQELSDLFGGASDDGSNEAALSAALQECLREVQFAYADGFSLPDIRDYVG